MSTTRDRDATDAGHLPGPTPTRRRPAMTPLWVLRRATCALAEAICHGAATPER